MTSTRTVANLVVSRSTFEEIHTKLQLAGYDHAVSDTGIDMHGIQLVREPEPTTKPITEVSHD